MGLGTLGEVWDGSGNHREGLGRVGGTLGRSGTDRGIAGEVLDGSRTIPVIRDLSGDHRGGPGRVGGLSGR